MKNNFKEINVCEVCSDSEITSVLNLGFHPMCDDLVPIGDSRVCSEYPIEIMFCQNCCTAHQRYQVPKIDLFPTTYHYRSRFTSDVLNGMKELVNSCKQEFTKIENKKVLDIGCNDGSLLDFFKAEKATTFGIEPTGACNEANKKGHITFNEFLSEDVAKRIVSEHGHPDIITFTNVFAHIENLKEVIESLKILMSTQSMIIIENHYLGSILDGNQFDTFYHEHPRTYSYTSFVHMARSLGVSLVKVEFPSRYGGNIRIFFGNATNKAALDLTDVRERELRLFSDFERMKSNVEIWQSKKKQYIHELVSKTGKLKAKAFPGRAAILIKLLELNENHISAVYEKPGSLKIGHYVPGTRIPICSDSDLFTQSDSTSPLLNLAWHIHKEINSYLNANNYTGRIIDILSAEDFIQKQ